MIGARIACVCSALLLGGCAALLPSSAQQSHAPWPDYQTAERTFRQVQIETTSLQDLHALGIDPGRSPNILLLSHADLMRRLALSGGGDPAWLAPQIQACIKAQLACFAYEIEQKSISRQRNGNFFLDFLGFHRRTAVSGWQFDALFIIHNDVVVYKLWSGTPSIESVEKETTPLGPLQNFDPSVLGL
ncbi:hypothetical protein [Chitinilyticum litopenaei]|uniref:hypothetical protein n=1 Tax=Chitinilyticum litopenaei TaxID=1121276 RepID=UPI00041120D3|nr:hypothetical protein [Chitinilyticum litopenaei]